MLPQTSVYPAERRATRALLRRRMHLTHTRAELLAHVQNTPSQYNLPAIGKKIADKANREGGAERFAAPAVQQSIEVDLALITSYDALLRAVELTMLKTARVYHMLKRQGAFERETFFHPSGRAYKGRFFEK
jgi:hypothetical protein